MITATQKKFRFLFTPATIITLTAAILYLNNQTSAVAELLRLQPKHSSIAATQVKQAAAISEQQGSQGHSDRDQNPTAASASDHAGQITQRSQSG